MKVKVGNKVYDEKFEPVMVILSPQDKLNIAAMPEGATRYCAYPEGKHTDEEINKWIVDTGVGTNPVLPRTQNIID